VGLHLGRHRHDHRRRRVRRRLRRRAVRHRGDPGSRPATAVALLVIAFAVNYSGTRTLARIAQIGLAAELFGVVALGLFLLLFRREQPFSVFFDPLGAGGQTGLPRALPAAALSGLFLFYGFEACGDVAEEVADPTRRIPRAMILTIVVGGVSGFCPTPATCSPRPTCRPSWRRGPDPIPSILESSLGTVGAKVFLVVTVVAFLSCVLSLQAAGSRLLYAFARDRMLPASGWLGHVSSRHAVPANALLVVCVVPVLICLFVFFRPDTLARVTASPCSASTSPSRRSCWPRCASGCWGGVRPGGGTSARPGSR
jgi:amino acid transporter